MKKEAFAKYMQAAWNNTLTFTLRANLERAHLVTEKKNIEHDSASIYRGN